MKLNKKLFLALTLCCLTQIQLTPLRADLVFVENAGFEDVTGQTIFNEFTFGIPSGWQRYDPNGIQGGGVFWGTLMPNGTDFFNGPAPEGDRVALLFNRSREGDGEYGYSQTLAETLQANTIYELQVEVGNIASGVDTSGTFYNLDHFPGYRIDLMAGNEILSQDINTLNIAEGEFDTSVIQFSVGSSHAQLGEQLGIRLVSLNQIPAGFTQATSPDLEVDFDNVVLSATAIPEPGSLLMCFWAMILFAVRRNRNRS